MDPRIHFALVCGSRSCAPIRFYEADHIDEQLDIAARSFVKSSEVIVVPEQGKVFLSQIFRWYKRDFGGRRGVFDFLLRYLDKDEKSVFLQENITIFPSKLMQSTDHVIHSAAIKYTKKLAIEISNLLLQDSVN